MKTVTTLILLLLTALSINAQTANWLWAHGEGTGYVGPQSIARDASGNIYVTGNITDSIMIFGTDTLVNEATDGAANLFVVKYDSLGNVLWAASAGGGADEGTEYVEAAGIGVDAAGNVYIIGAYETPYVIFAKDSLASIANQTSFLVKYNTQGTAQWALNIGNDLNTANGIAVDASGNSYITGNFTSGNFIGGTDTLTALSYVNGYTIKYDSSGNSIWAAEISGGTVVDNYAVATDAWGNAYVTGSFSGDSAVVAGNIILTNTGSSSVYTVKYNRAGVAAWARNASVSQDIYSTAIGTDGQGNVYIAGTTTADTITVGNYTATTGVSTFNNYFIARYDSSGNAKWIKSSQGYPYAYAQGLSTDVAGNTYLTGFFQNAMLIVGNDTLTDTASSLDSREALFVAKYDSSGNVVWATGGLTASDDADGGAGIIADDIGNFYLSGYYTGPTVVFGNDTLSYSGNPGYYAYVFVARYGNFTTGIASSPVAPNTITVYPNPSGGQFYFKGINSGSRLEVYNMLGQNIFSAEVTGNIYLLNIFSQAKGVYLYRIMSKDCAVQEGKMVLE
jgi:hypothetical protein